MSRISKVPLDKWDDKFRSATQSQVGIMPVLAHIPEVGAAVVGVYGALAKTRTLSRRLLELVRLRIAFRNQCRTCMAVRYGSELEGMDADEDAICALEQPLTSDILTPEEKLAIEYADKMCIDHLAINDAFFDRLRQHFSEPQIVELAVNVAVLIGFGRLAATLHLVDHLPEDYREESAELFAPWQNSPMPVMR